MRYNRIVISSGHSNHVRGASDELDEVTEARRVVHQLAVNLRAKGVEVKTFHDNVSTTQSLNLKTIVNYHNNQERDLDVSIHFNAYVETTKPMGTECLYTSQKELASQISSAIALCGFINRGAKKRTDLYFLNNTEMPAILIETCFVDSTADAEIYKREFDAICESITDVLCGEKVTPAVKPDVLRGKVSWFGGPNDKGVAPNEGLAFIFEVEQAPHLFLPEQPTGTTGLARRLDQHAHYIACRWDYDKTPHEMLLEEVALVKAIKTGRVLTAFPADWGPHVDTDRVADISPGLMEALGIQTDDEVEVIFPYRKLL
jgi:N-acetylmuramoyl-L-alanine amidase-like protein